MATKRGRRLIDGHAAPARCKPARQRALILSARDDRRSGAISEPREIALAKWVSRDTITREKRERERRREEEGHKTIEWTTATLRKTRFGRRANASCSYGQTESCSVAAPSSLAAADVRIQLLDAAGARELARRPIAGGNPPPERDEEKVAARRAANWPGGLIAAA